MEETELVEGISVKTVRLADELAVAVFTLVDPKALTENSVNELMERVFEATNAYRQSRLADVEVTLWG